MGAIISYRTLSPFQGWGFYCAIFPGRCPGLSYFAPSGQMQAFRKDFWVPGLSKGPSQNSIFIQSLTHPALKDMSSFRGLFCFPCNSVANASASVFFRVNPWQMLILNSVAHASGSERHVAFVFPKPCIYKGLR